MEYPEGRYNRLAGKTAKQVIVTKMGEIGPPEARRQRYRPLWATLQLFRQRFQSFGRMKELKSGIDVSTATNIHKVDPISYPESQRGGYGSQKITVQVSGKPMESMRRMQEQSGCTNVRTASNIQMLIRSIIRKDMLPNSWILSKWKHDFGWHRSVWSTYDLILSK